MAKPEYRVPADAANFNATVTPSRREEASLGTVLPAAAQPVEKVIELPTDFNAFGEGFSLRRAFTAKQDTQDGRGTVAPKETVLKQPKQ